MEAVKSKHDPGQPIIIDVVFSPQIAADFKAMKISAFIPVSAAELIWLESLPTNNEVI